MSNEKIEDDNSGRSRVAGGEDFEVEYYAELAGITQDQARVLIRRYGNDRARLMEEAKLLKAKRKVPLLGEGFKFARTEQALIHSLVSLRDGQD